jgi:hypothetical protein
MRIGGRQATGAEIRHSRWPSWCAVLFEKSDVRKKMWSGQRSARGLLAKPTNRPVIIYIRFFMYESYDIRKNRKANCSTPRGSGSRPAAHPGGGTNHRGRRRDGNGLPTRARAHHCLSPEFYSQCWKFDIFDRFSCPPWQRVSPKMAGRMKLSGIALSQITCLQ